MTRSILALTLLAALLSMPVTSASADDRGPAVEAWNTWQAGDLEGALRLSSKAVASTPDSSYAWTIHGFLLSQAGRKEEALAAYERAETLAPRDATVLNNLGTVLLAHGRLDDAEAKFRRALELKPGYADALNNVGVVEERRGHESRAEASYARAVSIDPQHARAHTNLGAIALKQGRTDEARQRFDQAQALDAELGAPRLNLLLLDIHDAPAEESLARLREMARNTSAPRTARAGAFSALAAREVAGQRFEAARSLYLEALALTPTDPDLLNNAAVAEDQLGLHREAMLHLEAALSARPQSMVARNNVGIVLVHRGSWDLAESVFRDIIERDPNFHRAHYNLGVALAAQGRQSDAIASFERAAGLAPKDASAQYNLGVLRRQLGGDDAAELRSYERALVLDDELVEAHLSLGCFLADPQTRADLRDEARAKVHLTRFLELALPEDEDGRSRAQAWLDWMER